jgi:single-stranded-DNA-specific exonuclease
VGVAFLLMAALNRLLPGEPMDMRQVLDLVALGTLADVVKLRADNRILVKNGMLLINEARRPGIFALKEAAGVNPSAEMGAGQVVFTLAPRINAAGRLGHAGTALDLLLAKTRDEARPLAAQLEAFNAERKQQEADILAEAMDQARAQLDKLGLVLHGANWNSGVIGIVASRIVETFHRPALLLCTENGLIKGSGRSIDGFDIHAGLTENAHLFTEFGGHRLAAGMSLTETDLPALREAFPATVAKTLGDVLPRPTLRVDASLDLSRVDHSLIQELALLQPFGAGNPEPVFQCAGVHVVNRKVFGERHVRLDVRHGDAGPCLAAKAWRQAEHIPASIKGQCLDVAFTPKLNTFRGVVSVELNLKDWKAANLNSL